MRLIAAISVVLALAVTGCGGGSSSTSTSSSSSPAASPFHPAGVNVTPTTPPASSTVAQVVWDEPYGEPASLDPLKSYALPENTVLSNACDALLRTGPDLKLQPGLASSWTHPTPTTWVFKIRPGVRFWDGHPLTVGDVLYSLNRHLNPKLGTFYTAWVADIKSIAQSGPSEVTLTTKVPDVIVAQMMASGLGTVIEKAYAEAKGAAYGTASGGIMCSGPFQFKSWQTGSQITLTRNPGYWDPSLQPKVQTLIFKFITDATTLTNALAAGAIDGTYEVPIQGIARLGGAGKMYYGLSTNQGILQPIQKTGLSANAKVREALSMVIDRTGIAHTVFQGLAVPELAAVPPDSFSYATQRYQQWYLGVGTPTTPNVAAARKLVEEAGNPKSAMTIGIQQGDSQSAAVATAIQSAAKSIGLNMQVKALPTAQYVELIFSEKARAGIDWTTGNNNYIDQAEPLQVLYYWGRSNSPYNLDGFAEKEVDSLFAQARAQAEPEQRAALAVRALQLWVKPVNNIPLYIYPERLFMNKRITGAPSSFSTFLYYPWAAELGGT
ncbi:MAG TPA: ABC transporter substrate-binding protein [Solirubrobacteraceae bacterium]|jgi:peptide/nickel transport system substrate-binding protein|nr:ABC transporter substrate-binding protein [Solirubrobacteraceae bacterium]